MGRHLRRILTVVALLVGAGVLTIVAPTGSAAGGAWTSLGPDGGNITALAGDPNNGQVLYAGTLNGIFRSVDGAGAWNQIAGGSALTGQIESIRVSPAAASTLYALQYAGLEESPQDTSISLHRSTDGGFQWSAITPPVSSAEMDRAIALDPTSAETVYVTGVRIKDWQPHGTVLKSTNGGTSWTFADTGLPQEPYPTALIVSPHNPNVLLAGLDGVYISQDGGASWAAARTGLPQDAGAYAQVWKLWADPVRSGYFYANTPAGLYRSTDNAQTWTAATAGLPLNVSIHQGADLVVNPSAPDTLVFAHPAGIFMSTNGGASWTESDHNVPAGRYGSIGLVQHPSQPTTLYVGKSVVGVYRTLDGAQNWTPANIGLRKTPLTAITFAPSQPATLYASAGEAGVYRSLDRGSTWTLLAPNDPVIDRQVQTIAVHPTNPNMVFAGTTSGVYLSTNGGNSWSRSSTGLPDAGGVAGMPGPSVLALAIHPSNPSTMFSGGSYIGVRRSTDGGATWTALSPSHIQSPTVRTIAFDSMSGNTLHAGGDHYHQSVDGGSSWTLSGIANGVNALAVDSSAPNTVYVGNSSGVKKTVNGGGYWTSVDTGLPTDSDVRALIVDPRSSNVVYAGTRAGVFWTENAGANWTALGTDFPHTQVTSLTIDAAAGALYAGTLAHGALALQLPALTVPTPTASVTVTPSPTMTPLPTATATAVPSGALCSPRPRVDMSVATTGDGRLRTTLSAYSNPGTNNSLHAVTVGPFSGAIVEIAGFGQAQSSQRIELPTGTQAVTVLGRPTLAGQGATIPLMVTDGCGDWQTLFGGGAGAFP